MRVVNQITFEAKDDAEALRLAAERLGKDAVILSTRPVKVGGVLGLFQKSVLMVSAGILEETRKETKIKDPREDEETRRESLIAFQKLMEFKERSAGGASRQAAVPGRDNTIQPLGTTAFDPSAGTLAAPVNTALGSPDGDKVHLSSEALRSVYGLKQADSQGSLPLQPSVSGGRPGAAEPPLSAEEARLLKDEVGALKQHINSLMERLAVAESDKAPQAVPGRDVPKNNPASFHAGLPTLQDTDAGSLSDRDLEERLRASEVDEKYIRKLLADYGISDRRIPFTDWLASRIKCAGDGDGDATGGRKVMLMGPTGVGKTTTIAKLAAIQALLEHKDVLFLTSDTFRIAAVEQLKTYAKILGVPIEVIYEAENLPSLLEEHKKAELILLDTAGRSQRDRKSTEVFESLYDAFRPDAVHLVLAANMKYRDMLDVVEHIPNIPISHLIFTKLDETVSYGAIFNIQQVMDCPVSFLTAGQNVPKDIETASGKRIAEFLMMTEQERRMV